MKQRVKVLWSGCGLIVGLATSACIPPTLQECPVAEDQKGSFMAPAEDFPMKLVGDSSWSENERESLIRAVDRWNIPAREMMNQNALEVDFASVSSLANVEDLEGCDLTDGSSARFLVYRVDTKSQWETLGFAENTPAVTIRCHRGDQLAKQAVLVNPALIHQEQLTSVFLHEFGHSLGLDHSCQLDRGSESHRACSGLSSDHEYVLAVMFPTLRVMSPAISAKYSSQLGDVGIEKKEQLRKNDLFRISCIFSR